MYLSGGSSLASSAAAVTAGSTSFLTPPLGAPTSVTEISAISQAVPLLDVAGTYAKFVSAPLAANTDVVGVPTVTLRLSAPLSATAGALDPAGQLTLFFKLEDISPGGTATLPDRLISPTRIASTDDPVTITLPGIVHRFAAGDRIALVIAGSDAAYRASIVPTRVTISTGPSTPGALTLPVAPQSSYGPLAFASVPATRHARHHKRHVKRRAKHHGARRVQAAAAGSSPAQPSPSQLGPSPKSRGRGAG
jgi:ABC-2 type transport system ATP-binding protein